MIQFIYQAIFNYSGLFMLFDLYIKISCNDFINAISLLYEAVLLF